MPRLHQHLAVFLAHPALRADQEAVAARLSRDPDAPPDGADPSRETQHVVMSVASC